MNHADVSNGGTRNIISQPDLWIAAITQAASRILVTTNSGEFSRVPDLAFEERLHS